MDNKLRYCSKCQSNISKNSKFCAKCGMKYVAPIPKEVESVQLNSPNISSKSNTDVNIKLAAGIIVGLLFGFIFASAFTSETITVENAVDNTVELDSVNKLVNSLELELNSVNKLNNEYKTDNELLEQQIKEYGDMQALLLDVNSQLESIKNEKSILESKIASNLDEISQLERLNAELNNRPPPSNNQRELDELLSKVEILENRQENLESTKSALEVDITLLNNQITKLNEQIAILEDENTDFKTLNEELQLQLDEATANSIKNFNEVKYVVDSIRPKIVLVWRCVDSEDVNGFRTRSPITGEFHYVEGKYFYCYARGTGYFISTDGCLLTNAHVTSSGDYTYVIELFNGDMKRAYLLKVEGAGINSGAQIDFALLRANSITTTYIKFATSHPQANSQVVTVGHPSNLGYWVRTVGDYDGRNSVGGYLFRIPSAPGASGSPIVNLDNELVGMLKAGTRSDYAHNPLMPGDNIIITKHNFGVERGKRSYAVADNIFSIKSFVSGTNCQP